MRKSFQLRPSEMLFLIAFCIRLTIGIVNISVLFYDAYGPLIYNLGWYLSMAFAIASFAVYAKTTIAKGVLSLAVVILFLLSYFYTDTTKLIELFVFMMAAQSASLEKVKKLFVAEHVAAAVILVVLSTANVIENITWIQGARTRYSLGYRYTTYISKVLFFVTVYYISVRRREFRLIELAAIEAVNYAIYYWTNSRTTFYLLLLFPVICYVLRWRKPRKAPRRFTRFVFQWTYVLCAVVSFAAVYMYMTHYNILWMAVDQALSGRLTLTSQAINSYGIHMFAPAITWVGQVAHSMDVTQTINFIDCSYVNIALTYGVIPFALVITMSVYIMRYLIDQNEPIELVLQIMCAVHFIIEPQLLDLTYCIFMLYFFHALNYFRTARKARRTARGLRVRQIAGA